jgi:hypothetical protein
MEGDLEIVVWNSNQLSPASLEAERYVERLFRRDFDNGRILD